MMIQLIAGVVGGITPAGKLSGEVIVDSVTDPVNAECGIKFQSTGFVQKFVGGVFTTIDSATDWIIPRVYANGDWDVRFTGTPANAFTTSAAVEDTWINLGSDRIWLLERLIVGTSTADVTFELRNPAGVTVSSVAYTFDSIVLA